MKKFLSLGPTPLANGFLKKEQLQFRESYYPLDVYFCENCDLVQLMDVVPPEVMFRKYPYLSSMTNTLRTHFAMLAKEIVERFDLDSDSLVVDIGSNDGTLLKSFRSLNCNTVGVEPATNIAKIAQEAGIETVNDFFSETVASKVSRAKGKAKVITGTNVFAHVNDLDGLLRGISTLLDDNGVFVIEVPYLVDLIERREFDTIYHEHLSYYALRPLVVLFKRFNMRIVDVKRIGIHGGSIRVYIQKTKSKGPTAETVAELLTIEKKLRLDVATTYFEFAQYVANVKDRLVRLLRQLKEEGNRIVGYGAAAKGNTLLNYCKIGSETIDYIVDKTPLKQGLYTPGTHIPIAPPEKILEDMPDYVLTLAWNFLDEILQNEERYRGLGGKFIVPIPEPKIIA